MVRFEQVLIAATLFGLMILLGSSLLIETNTNYNLNADTTVFNDNLTSSLDRTRGVSEEVRNNSQLNPISEETTDGELYKSQTSTNLKIWDSFKLIQDSINLISKEFGLPTFIIQGFYTILAILSGAFAFYMIMRFKPQKD